MKGRIAPLLLLAALVLAGCSDPAGVQGQVDETGEEEGGAGGGARRSVGGGGGGGNGTENETDQPQHLSVIYDEYGTVADGSGTVLYGLTVYNGFSSIDGRLMAISATLSWSFPPGDLEACLVDDVGIQVAGIPCAQGPSPLTFTWSNATAGVAALPDGYYDVDLLSPSGPQAIPEMHFEATATVL